jgi:hypothetical protein
VRLVISYYCEMYLEIWNSYELGCDFRLTFVAYVAVIVGLIL